MKLEGIQLLLIREDEKLQEFYEKIEEEICKLQTKDKKKFKRVILTITLEEDY